ncbi:hypothetical protein AAG906_026086 [Vitis piasezkii]
MRQFSQLGMPLSRAFQKLMEGGLLTTLAPRPPPQPLPPQFRMDLHSKCDHEPFTCSHHTFGAFASGGIHHMDFVQDDVIHMLSWDDGLPEMILIPFTPSYVGHRDMFAPFILWPEDVDVQIRVETYTTPEGLIHMMIADRATCIVFSTDDLPSEGSDHTRPIYITVVCSGHRVSSVLLDNGSTLNVCPLATAVALGFAPSDFGPST